MQYITAQAKYVRIASKKVRRVAHVLKGMSLIDAEAQLRQMSQKSVQPLMKVLHSAGANAEHNYRLHRADLFVTNILVDPGPSLKRSRPRARGSAFPILKRTSHITVMLASRQKSVQSDSEAGKAEGKSGKSVRGIPSGKGKIEKKMSMRALKKDISAKKRTGVKTRVFQRKAI